MTSAPKYSDELIATMNQFFVATEPEPNEEADTEPKPATNHLTPEFIEYLYNYDFEANRPIDTEEEEDDETKLDLEDINHFPSDHEYVRDVGHVIFYEPIRDYVFAEEFKEMTNYKPGFCRHCDNEQKFCYERNHGIKDDTEYNNESDEECGTEYDNESDEEYDTEYDNESDKEFDTEYDNESDEEYGSENDAEYDSDDNNGSDTEYDDEYDNDYDHNSGPDNDLNNKSDNESENDFNPRYITKQEITLTVAPTTKRMIRIIRTNMNGNRDLMTTTTTTIAMTIIMTTITTITTNINQTTTPMASLNYSQL